MRLLSQQHQPAHGNVRGTDVTMTSLCGSELKKSIVTLCVLVNVVIFSVCVRYRGLVFDSGVHYVVQVTSLHLPISYLPQVMLN